MTILQLQYFQTLARVLHYTRAAEELHISQPSLSYSISELEKELITTDPGGQISAADALVQLVGYMFKYLVPKEMAVFIIGLLEVVQIDHC